MENIDRYKLKVRSHEIELEAPLDRDKRLFVLSEMEIFEVGSVDNNDGSFNQVFKAKLVGSSEIKQEGKIVKGKSKRSSSQKLRQAIWVINSDEEFYESVMGKIIRNLEDVVEYLKDK
jgi:hypothetical protein